MRYSLRTLFVVFTVMAVVPGLFWGEALRQSNLGKVQANANTIHVRHSAPPSETLDAKLVRARRFILERAATAGIPEFDKYVKEASRQEKLVGEFITAFNNDDYRKFHANRPDWLPASLDIWQARRARRFDLHRSLDLKLSAITNFPNLEEAYIASIDFSKGMMGSQIPLEDLNDLSPLDEMRNLKKLLIDVKRIGDLEPLANLSKLEVLYLRGLDQPDLSPLSGLKNLRQIELSGKISRASQMSGLDSLEKLELCSFELRDISGLGSLVNLKNLYVGGNELRDITALQNLTKLESLAIWSKSLRDISALSNMTSLRTLSLDSTAVSPEDVERLRQQLPQCKISCH